MSNVVMSTFSKAKTIALSAVVSIALAPSAFAITLEGETLTFQHVNDIGTGLEVKKTYDSVVGHGHEANFYNLIKIDVTGDILKVYAKANARFGAADFNGFAIKDTNLAVDAFTSFEQLDGATFKNVETSFDNETLYINFGKAGSFRCGDHIRFRIGTTALTPPSGGSIPGVPLPGTLPLLLGGMGLLGWRGFKKSR